MVTLAEPMYVVSDFIVRLDRAADVHASRLMDLLLMISAVTINRNCDFLLSTYWASGPSCHTHYIQQRAINLKRPLRTMVLKGRDSSCVYYI